MTEVIIFRTVDDGWDPIDTMAALAARLLEGRLTVLPLPSPRSRFAQLAASARSRVPMRQDGAGTLYIARGPADLGLIAGDASYTRPGAFRAVWIVDSFWTDHLPHRMLVPHFDLVGFTQGYDREPYSARFGDRAIHLGWGTDALDMGSAGSDRAFDILRVGRQPEGWEDDRRTADIASRYDLAFHGRPPSAESADPRLRQAALMRDWLARTKIVVASTNLIGNSAYVHSHKEYYTARWTDALACGASVAGCAPRTDGGLIEWPEALIDLPGRDAGSEMAVLAEAVADWNPDRALANHLGALKHLDWRWRIADLAGRLGLRTDTLSSEMARLRQAIGALERGHPAEIA